MMNWSPAVDEVIRYLNEQGKVSEALLIGRLLESERHCRIAMYANLQSYYELRDRYEPRPQHEPYANWTGD